MSKFSRASTIAAFVVAIALLSSAFAHQLQWGAPGYQDSFWIPIELGALVSALLGIIPQLVAAVVLFRGGGQWRFLGIAGLLALLIAIAGGLALDAATLLYAT